MTDSIENPSLNYGQRGTVRIVDDAEALAHEAAILVVSTLTAAASTGQATLALSGGSTPRRMGELLTQPEYRDQIAWEKIHVFWGDERWVPESSDESNAGVAKRTFLDHVPIPKEQIHPWDTTFEHPQDSADAYEGTLRGVFGVDTDWPVFDLVLLGMGDDGHTASLFPGTTAVHDREHWTLAHYVPKLDSHRLTFTAPLITAARTVVFLVGGAGKAETLSHVLDGPIDIDTYPSQAIRPTSGSLFWIVDHAAAANLQKDPPPVDPNSTVAG